MQSLLRRFSLSAYICSSFLAIFIKQTPSSKAQQDGITIAPVPSNISRYEAPAAATVTVNGRSNHVYAFLHEGMQDGNQPVLPSNGSINQGTMTWK